ncbi:MAG: LysM peptidoglycan-binding domain-containing protein [Bacillota bacterium]|nr:LysM peptidoglycan-binding domain-containing protein [Bacillota bacterium]
MSIAHRRRRAAAVIIVAMILIVVTTAPGPAMAATSHTVVRGDTLWLLAQRYGTTVAALKTANGLTSDTIYVGQVLAIPGAATTPTGGALTYTVRSGDTLWLIAARNGTTVDALMAVNGLTRTIIYPGQVLLLPRTGAPTVPSAPVDPLPEAGAPFKAARFVYSQGFTLHRVQAGEYLSKIANDYGTTVDAIWRTNQLNSDKIMIAQPLFVQRSGTTAGAVSVTTGPHGPDGQGELMAWEQARWIFNVGKTATVRDVRTGGEFKVKYYGGSNHADCEPLTPADTQTMLSLAGGGWTWNTRPIAVLVDGRAVAASMNFMPHGGQSIYSNNFGGHFCIHFRHSRTHGTNSVHAGHQRNVLEAAGLTGVALPPGL